MRMKMRMRQAHTPAGFTMIEVMLSVLIVAMVLTMVYSSFRAGSKATQFGSERAQLFHTARIAMQDIIQAIENLEWMPNTNKYMTFTGKPGGGVAVAGVHGGGDELEFVTSTSPTLINGQWQSGLARVRYMITDNDTGGSGAKTARSHLVKMVTRLKDDTFDDAYTVELSDNVVGFKCRYFDETSYEDSWDSDVKERLPEVVEITLYVQDKDSVQALRSGALIPNMMVRQGRTVQGSQPQTQTPQTPRPREPVQRPQTTPGTGRTPGTRPGRTPVQIR